MSASGSVVSAVLGLKRFEVATAPSLDYGTRLELEQSLNTMRDRVDLLLGMLTGSCYEEFVASSSFDGIAGGADVYAEYNPGPARTLQEVIAWCGSSGSGGVTTIDIQIQQGPGGNFASIFGPLGGPPNNAMRVALSSSLGNYGLAKQGQSSFVSGTNMVWQPGTLMKCVFTTAAGAVGGSAMKNIVTQVRWSPSGSWPNSLAPA